MNYHIEVELASHSIILNAFAFVDNVYPATLTGIDFHSESFFSDGLLKMVDGNHPVGYFNDVAKIPILISEELAAVNNLYVGSVFELVNLTRFVPFLGYEERNLLLNNEVVMENTYTFKVVGLFRKSSYFQNISFFNQSTFDMLIDTSHAKHFRYEQILNTYDVYSNMYNGLDVWDKYGKFEYESYLYKEKLIGLPIFAVKTQYIDQFIEDASRILPSHLTVVQLDE